MDVYVMLIVLLALTACSWSAGELLYSVYLELVYAITNCLYCRDW